MKELTEKAAKKLVGEFLFWLHLAIILSAGLLWLLISLPYIIAIFILHQLHLLVWKGCSITFFQKKLGAMPKHQDFLPYAMKRLFRINLTNAQNRIITYLTALLSIFLAILDTFTHYTAIIIQYLFSLIHYFLKFFGL